MASASILPASATLLRTIDHSLLIPVATAEELRHLCLVADQLGVASVCLLPYFVRDAAALLAESPVVVSTVVAFPHGALSPKAKLAEAKVALLDGARELDFVINISAVVSGNWQLIQEEVRQLTALCHDHGARIKVIFENCYLSDAQKVALCEISTAAGVDWVKTSTGFGQPAAGASGATAHDVRLMRQHCPAPIGVKASGGIRTLADVRAMIELGASRVGTSRTEEIARELGLEVRR